MLGFYNYTVILTYLSVSSATIGIWMATQGRHGISIICLMLCGLFDTFDGTVAKMRIRSDAERMFGIQIDSLADLICFGALPVAIGFSVGMHGWMVAVSALYILCALIRLAYFNVTEEELSAVPGKSRQSYDGLPVTSSALIFPVVYSFAHLIGKGFSYVYCAFLFVVAILFVSKFKIRKFGLKGMLVLVFIGFLELVWLILGKHYGLIL
ncbi:MAG: CDP-alcohol phosphatidyltransferase family protein [Oscillospiraceae bacterium]